MIDTGVPRISIAGCPVDVITKTQTMALIERIIAQRTPCRHGFVNAAKVVKVQSDSTLLDTLSTCDLINADGMGIIWASKVLATPLPERVNGTNLMLDLVRLAHEKSHRLFLLGARPEVVQQVAETFQNQYPGLKIVGWHHGYFSLDDERHIARQIRKARPDILFVGMGTPLKEYWLRRNVPTIEVPFSMGVGGSFDVVAGLVRRAPTWAQNAGLEWLWRLLQEPGKMWRRYLLGNPHFILLVVKEKIRKARKIDSIA